MLHCYCSLVLSVIGWVALWLKFFSSSRRGRFDSPHGHNAWSPFQFILLEYWLNHPPTIFSLSVSRQLVFRYQICDYVFMAYFISVHTYCTYTTHYAVSVYSKSFTWLNILIANALFKMFLMSYDPVSFPVFCDTSLDLCSSHNY